MTGFNKKSGLGPTKAAYALNPEDIRDIAPEVLDEAGRLRVLPASYWATTKPEERLLFGHRYGLYSFPTAELVDHLRGFIGDQSAIEIGAGHGVLAEALGIPATDSREQATPEFRALLAIQGQPPVTYGPNVIEAHASRAIRRFRPDVVVACWVTQKFLPGEEWSQGHSKLNGVDEVDIIRQCRCYVLVGNERVHERKRIWARPHTIDYPPWLYSRAMNGSREFIAVWEGSKS